MALLTVNLSITVPKVTQGLPCAFSLRRAGSLCGCPFAGSDQLQPTAGRRDGMDVPYPFQYGFNYQMIRPSNISYSHSKEVGR